MCPLFEYQCPRCGNVAEKLQKTSEDGGNVICFCTSPCTTMHKRLSTTSLRFVGAGFYENDYKKRT